MKTNCTQFSWAAAAVLLFGVAQSAWAGTCTQKVHVMNTVPSETIEVKAVMHQLSGFPYVYEKLYSAELNQSDVHTTVFNLPYDNCSNLKWRAKITYVCRGKTQAYTAKTLYFSPGQYTDLYVNVTNCEGHIDYQQDSFPQRAMEISGNALQCPKKPQVLLYPDENKAGQPVVISNKVISNFGRYTDLSGRPLNDWAASLEVTSGTWRFFKHANFEGPQLYVAGPHTIDKLALGNSTWSQDSAGIFAHALTSLKPISCNSKQLGTASPSSPVSLGYLYGYQDNGCLQKVQRGFRNGIDIHYGDQCNGHTQQNRAWFWDPVTGYIHNLENPNYCVVRATGAGFRVGDKIELRQCAGTTQENKQWNYNTDTHQIRARLDGSSSGFCIEHSGTHNGGKIQLWSCSPNDGNSNNQWKITWAPNGN